MQDYSQAHAYILTLTGQDPASIVMDFRCLHDTDRATPGIPIRDTLPNAWQQLIAWNNAGYGCFVNFNALDGTGRKLENVSHIRAHVIDLDNPATAAQSYASACAWYPAPSFAVSSSPGKAHIYWQSTPYKDNERFTVIERKLVAQFGGDHRVIDATRVLRLPGTLHLKNPASPYLVTCHGLPGFGYVTPPEALEQALIAVQVRSGGDGARSPLGDPDKAAPSLEWAKFALYAVDPNQLDRDAWISATAAFKQAAWSHGTPEEIRAIWDVWCARYDKNDPGENDKQFSDITNTQVGWAGLAARSPHVQARLKLGEPVPPPQLPVPQQPGEDAPRDQTFPTMMDGPDLQRFFHNCVFVERFGTILTPEGRMMGPGQFNGRYGGYNFMLDPEKATTDEAWKAATRSRLWRIPTVDHTRFVPAHGYFAQIVDDLGRIGVNTYKPINVKRRSGDVSPFLNHLKLMIPDDQDRAGFIEFLAHNAKYPGHKIPWAYMLQSAEGAGKGIIKAVIRHIMGGPYVHYPNAKELIESGSKFNAWMRSKLFIVVDEIKVDERRDMIEVLKPMISEKEIEIQGKGHDQDKEDNYSNWIFFSNYKDAIPINKNGRRFAIIYSAIQSNADLIKIGMNQAYFDHLYNWLENGYGNEIVADYLLKHPIALGNIPMRAPVTTSTIEAILNSRGPTEAMIHECIEDGLPGFKQGWISTVAVNNMIKARGLRAVSPVTLATVLKSMGYSYVGRATRPYMQEDMKTRTNLYHIDERTPVDMVAIYGAQQEYF